MSISRFLKWFAGCESRLVLAAIVLAIAALSFLGFVSYSAAESSMCGFCHAVAENRRSLRESAHSSESCASCHIERGMAGFYTSGMRSAAHLAAAITGVYGKPVETRVSDRACLACHIDEVSKIRVSGGIRVSHKELNGFNCTECHGGTAHDNPGRVRTFPDMERCSGCHNGIKAANDCSICHPSGQKPQRTGRPGNWRVVHGESWKQTHGMGDVWKCVSCHTEDFCAKCHGISMPHPQPWSYLHSAEGKNHPDSCVEKCHNEPFCSDCHVLPMPHPAGFLDHHKAVVKKRGRDLCMRCHAETSCNPCHLGSAHPDIPRHLRSDKGGAEL